MPVNSPRFSIDVFNHYNTHVPTGTPITPMPTTESAEGTPIIQPGQTIKRILATYDETSATTIKRIKSTTTATSIIPPWRQKPPATPLRGTTTPAVTTPVQPAFPPPNYLTQKEQPRSWTPPHSRLRRIKMLKSDCFPHGNLKMTESKGRIDRVSRRL